MHASSFKAAAFAAASLIATAACSSSRAEAPAAPVMTVYKSPTCGCCANWVDHVKAAGFTVQVHDVENMTEIKDEAGVPRGSRSCHTALIDGYTLEGHVPAEDIRRLLDERPKIAGLAVPGMPVGSPGMEVPGQAADEYEVIAYTVDGATSVYASH